MKTCSIPSAVFANNRARLAAQMAPNSVAVLNANDVLPTNADGTLPLEANSDLYYLSGISQEESILVLAPNAADETRREILFLKEPNPHLALWEGHKLSKEEATRISGIKTVRWLPDFRPFFHALACEADHLYLNTNEHKRAVVEVETRDARFIRDCQARYPLHRYHRLARLMHDLRLVKSPEEIEQIRQACRITGAGFRRLLKFVRPGVNEREVQAELAHEFIRQGGSFSYNPIIAAGPNNCVLHYNTNDLPCRKGDLLLLDVASGFGPYKSDLTRTIPVSGRFSRRQRLVYKALLRAFRTILDATRPGILPRDWQKLAEKEVCNELVGLGLLKPADLRRQTPDAPAVKRYFMHGVGHPIGLDVHDVGNMNTPMAAGWVMTCEPAIYIPEEGFGIRLENTLLVTDDGPVDLMGDIPIEPEEIEELMNQ